jgi:hypothetical protein
MIVDRMDEWARSVIVCKERESWQILAMEMEVGGGRKPMPTIL